MLIFKALRIVNSVIVIVEQRLVMLPVIEFSCLRNLAKFLASQIILRILTTQTLMANLH